MNYQNLICFGDSQTFGARSYGCYPLFLAKFLSEDTPYHWRTINRSDNGYTARDLWFKINQEIDSVSDTFICCLLIGTNDVGNGTDIELFGEYYTQILRTLVIKRFKVIVCGEIPPIFPDGHSFFEQHTSALRLEYNKTLQQAVAKFPKARTVSLDHLTRDDYEDPVHFNEKGNISVARAFAKVVSTL
jgi:lysophospholipase L1-like esterase